MRGRARGFLRRGQGQAVANKLATWPVVFLALWMGGHSGAAAQTPAWSGAGAGPGISVMEIPLTIDLRSLFRSADALLPRQVGHWKGWRRQHGIETRYRAWRGPLRMFLSGDLLRVEAHVRYWVQARRKILGGFDLKAGCGVDEPPRQAVVGVLVHLGWGPDWTLRPLFRVLPTRFIDRCEVTAADIDVSPLIDRLFRMRMEESLREALNDLTPVFEAARSRAAGYWKALQQPVELTPGLWLSADPLALGLAPPVGRGDLLKTNLGVVLVLALGAEPAAPAVPSPLPPLQSFIPRGSGMRFDLNLDLDMGELGRHLSGLLADKPLTVEGQRIGIGRVDLAGEGEELVMTALLTGEAAGRIKIWAEPVFYPHDQTIRLQELDFVFDPEDPEQALMINLFYQRIQKALQDGANELLAARTAAMRDAIESALSRSLSQDLRLDLSSLELERLDLTLAGSSIRLSGTAAGSLVVTDAK